MPENQNQTSPTTRSGKRSRITYLVDFYRTINAGTEKQLHYLLSSLPNFGYSICLYSLQDSEFLESEASQVFPGIKIRTFGASSDISRTPWALFRLHRALRQEKPDIVHTFFPTSNSLGILIAKLAGIRVLISSRRDMGYNLCRRDIWLLRIANCFANCIISNSEAVRTKTVSTEKLPLQKINVIYNGLELEKQPGCENKAGQNGPIVGIISNLNRPVKRVDLFVKAAAIVHEKIPEAKFWIIGDGPLRPELEKLATALNVLPYVKFLGKKQNIAPFLEQIDIGVNCSDSEGLSNAIMEYMLAGMPVVATRVGGNPELVIHGNTGLLTALDNPHGLAKAIIELLNDNHIGEKMGLAGRKFALERFSVRSMIDDTIKLYNCEST
jgi:glycosyltransferase involved in cell wall biosynthesis